MDELKPDIHLSSVLEADKPGLLSVLRGMLPHGFSTTDVSGADAVTFNQIRMLISLGLVTIENDRYVVNQSGRTAIQLHSAS